MTDLVDRRDVGEVNGLVDGPAYHRERNCVGTVPWNTKGLRVTRLRLLSDPGLPWWDVSYCHGRLDGEDVDVELPFDQLPKFKMRTAIVNYAKKEGVFARGLGILDNISTLC